MADQRPRNLDRGTRLILEELRDLRLEMRADRRRADEERREGRPRADEERRRYDEERDATTKSDSARTNASSG
jgi:hypothetical protein